MRRGLVGLVVGALCWGLSQCSAYAGVNEWRVYQWAKNTVRYVWEPVNCPVNYINKNISGHTSEKGDLWDFTGCVADNLNRNPATLNTLIQ